MENITYEKFIQNILDTRGRFACGDEYHERHHIVPRCLGGDNEEGNLIDLFAREHFIAHKLLAYENPNNDSLIYAWSCMAFLKNNHEQRYKLTPEEYEEARKSLSEVLKEKMIGENNPNYGKCHSEEAKEKMSNMAKARCTKEWRQKQSLAQKNRYKNKENNPMFGKNHTEEAKRKMSEKRRVNHTCAKIVVQLTIGGQIVKIFWSTKQVQQELSIDCGDISKCCNEKHKSAGGYCWRYLYDNKLKDKTIPGAITLGIITEKEALSLLQQDKMIKDEEEKQ